MDLVLLLKTIVVFAVMLGVLVVIHEFGHFAAARLAGMKVYEFAFGFGPILKRLFKRRETEYNIRVVPLGGFVRIAGMEPGEGEEIEGGFNSKPIWKRAIVILAGPFMSLLLGYLLLMMLGLVWGIDIHTSKITDVAKGSPAEAAGIVKGDTIVAINGQRIDGGYVINDVLGVKSGDGFLVRKLVSGKGGKELDVTVRRDGREIVIKATPQIDKESGMALLGVAIGDSVHIENPTVYQSILAGSMDTYRYISVTINTIFSKRVAKEAGGIVAIGFATHQTVKYAGVQGVFALLAMLSLALGIFNLIPLPILDGGHIVYLTVEKIRGKRMNAETMYKIQAMGLALIISLALFLVVYDIYRIALNKLF